MERMVTNLFLGLVGRVGRAMPCGNRYRRPTKGGSGATHGSCGDNCCRDSRKGPGCYLQGAGGGRRIATVNFWNEQHRVKKVTTARSKNQRNEKMVYPAKFTRRSTRKGKVCLHTTRRMTKTRQYHRVVVSGKKLKEKRKLPKAMKF